MANPALRVLENVPGEFFVDSSCIDCDACRQLAPAVFADAGNYSYVAAQPSSPDAERAALRALIACPTASIGTLHRNRAADVVPDFPLLIEAGVYYCGFNSPKSYGGNSYLVRHRDGNWLVDSPRYSEPLARAIERLGGVRRIFLTHRDDVADAARWAERFGAERIIHRLELIAQPSAERVLDGFEPVELAPEFLAIPTPGHTRGHCALLYRQRLLFTGDHLWWSRERQRLNASRDVCWYSWPQQAESMARLAEYGFEWVLPGHGQRVQLPPDEMQRQVRDLAKRMFTA